MAVYPKSDKKDSKRFGLETRYNGKWGKFLLGQSENPKVGKVKTGKKIIFHVTAPMSGQFLKSRSDRLSLAKLL